MRGLSDTRTTERTFTPAYARLTSAEIARMRLLRIVAADRAAVPCGCWVLKRRGPPYAPLDRYRWRVRR